VDILFICADANRAVMTNGKYYSQILDPVVDYCRIKSISHMSISLPFSSMLPSATYSNSRTLNWAYLFLRHNTWRWLLSKRIKTKLVVGINIPSELNSYAADNGIKTIELFHGFGIGENDYIWGCSARKNVDVKREASIYIAYDKQSYETLRQSLGAKRITVNLARHHFYDREEYSQLNLIDRIESKIERVFSASSNMTVLVSLQHGYDGSRSVLNGILDNGLLPGCLIEFIRDNPSINWILKPHPVQIRSNMWPKIQDTLFEIFGKFENVSVIDFLDDDVFALLHFVDGHITMMSGTVVEAAMLGVPSLGLCPTLRRGGIMQDAFQNEEAQELFFRGEATIESITHFVNHITLRRGGHARGCRRPRNDVLPSAISYITALL